MDSNQIRNLPANKEPGLAEHPQLILLRELTAQVAELVEFLKYVKAEYDYHKGKK